MKKALLFLFLFVVNVHAEAPDETINEACLKQAIALARQLKTDVFTDMNGDQAENVVRLSTASCKQQFAASNSGDVAVPTTAEDEESGAMDWFSEKILSGDTSRKEGNKRLERMRTR